jgi:hypothetical protein
MVAHACNPTTWGRLRQEDQDLEASLGFLARLPQTNTKNTKGKKSKSLLIIDLLWKMTRDGQSGQRICKISGVDFF